jgi:hypothetical protein
MTSMSVLIRVQGEELSSRATTEVATSMPRLHNTLSPKRRSVSRRVTLISLFGEASFSRVKLPAKQRREPSQTRENPASSQVPWNQPAQWTLRINVSDELQLKRSGSKLINISYDRDVRRQLRN